MRWSAAASPVWQRERRDRGQQQLDLRGNGYAAKQADAVDCALKLVL
jgi:hypothetical protein